MADIVKEHDPVSSWRKLLDAPQESDAWTSQRCWTLDVAQDQKLFRVIEGDIVKTYSGLRRGTDRDAQSDSGRETPKGPDTADFEALLRALRSRLASAWRVAEESLGTGASSDAESESFEAEHDDQPGIIEEIPDEWTSDRLADQLLKLDVENDWSRLRELVLTAEDFDFTPGKSALIAPRLLELATQYRDSNDSQDAPVVWSAIRTGASMLRPSDASRLLALLEPGHPIETSLVALKMLGRIFEAQPPDRPDQHADLACEVRGIAESLLNRYAIAGSQSAAMAQLAVCTLAAMASSETLLVVQAVRRIGVSWFSQQTGRELRELQNSWHARPQPVAPEVLDLLERAMNEVQTI